MVSILVVDDHSLMRRAIHEVFEQESDLVVVAEASNGQEAEEQATLHHPDVILMDVDMPDWNGFEATERVLLCSPQSRVIIFAPAHQDHLVFQAIQRGAIGYITKDTEPDALIHAVRCAARNDLCIPGIFATPIVNHVRTHWRLHNGYSATLGAAISYRAPRRVASASSTTEEGNEGQENTALPRPLTERERQILDLMRKGQKNREIAIELEIAESTVHKHVQNIFEKLHARNRTEAIYITSVEV